MLMTRNVTNRSCDEDSKSNQPLLSGSTVTDINGNGAWTEYKALRVSFDASNGGGSFASSPPPPLHRRLSEMIRSRTSSLIAMVTNWKSIYIVAIVAFIHSLELRTGNNDWNYFCKLDASASVTMLGIMGTVGGASGGICTLAAGWICNRLRDTRQVLLASKVLIFLAFCFLLSVELAQGLLFYALFLIYKLLTGMANGGSAMFRTHVAMASTEADRAKAFALTALFPACGLLVGSLISTACSFMDYPGPRLPLLGIHLNLFTAPLLFYMLIFCMAIYLLSLHFDGRWHIYERVEERMRGMSLLLMGATPDDEDTTNYNKGKNGNCNNGYVSLGEEKDILVDKPGTRISALISSQTFDWLGVCLCLFTQLIVHLVIQNDFIIIQPYQQLAFAWDSAQVQFLNGIQTAVISLMQALWPAAYIYFGLTRYVSERNAIIFCLGVLMCEYLLTYSWPFLPDFIPFASAYNPDNNDNNHQTAFGNASQQQPVSNCGAQSQPGCPSQYVWCATTTRPNMLVFIAATTLSPGMALPILRMNLDILYSKMLGNIKQGVWQALFVSGKLALEMAGVPIAMSWVFEKSGPRPIWQFIGSSLLLCTLLWLIFYRRMISHSERQANKLNTYPCSKTTMGMPAPRFKSLYRNCLRKKGDFSHIIKKSRSELAVERMMVWFCSQTAHKIQ